MLDDCTSALDAETEAQLVDGFDEILTRRTAIITTHRVSIAMRSELNGFLRQRVNEASSIEAARSDLLALVARTRLPPQTIADASASQVVSQDESEPIKG